MLCIASKHPRLLGFRASLRRMKEKKICSITHHKGDSVSDASPEMSRRSIVGSLLQEADSAEELMVAFGKAARLIQRSEFARCQSEQAASGNDLQLNGGAEVDEKSLATAKQVQTQLNKAMHAALSTSNGFLIIPTLPGPPIQQRYGPVTNLPYNSDVQDHPVDHWQGGRLAMSDNKH